MSPPGERGPLDFPEDDPHRGPRVPDPAERERAAARRQPPPPRRASGSSRYGWFAGLIAVLLLAYVGLNTIRTSGASSTGLKVGSAIPPFATPLALSDLKGDADIATRPDSGRAGRVAACDLRGPRILNVCQLSERGPLIVAFLATRGGRCSGALDTLDAVRRRSPGVQLAAISIKGDRGDLRKLVRAHRWTFPVGTDDDGALANLYGVSVCPQTTFTSVGGIVESTEIGAAKPAVLRRRVAQIVRVSEQRGWKAPAR